MERPGFLELAVYALVLTAAAAWVYALPPFTHDPAGLQSAGIQSGEIQSAAATSPGASGSDQSETAADPPVAERQSATASESDPQPNLLMVTARSLNMRSAPDAGSELVGNYPRGALVKPVETSGNWVLVRTVDDGSTGWMYVGYLGAAENN
jgi:uncharacterized protein YgiM (DUF1202 family)